jgi:hypothetical protein
MVEFSKEDAFDRACQRLERISELREKNRLEDAKYEELKNLLLSQITNLVSSSNEEIKEKTSQAEVGQKYFVPYGQLHMQIVKRISASYKSAEGNTKQRMFKAVSEMAEKQVLNPGDSADIEQIIEITFTPLPEVTPGNSSDEMLFDKVLKILRDLNSIYSKVKDSPNSSPATKAIAETTHQSAIEAAEEIRTRRNKPELADVNPQKLWRTLVLEDLDGCLQGGAAAVTMLPAFTIAFGPLSAIADRRRLG